MSVADMRQSYEKGSLLEANATTSPFEQFALWFNEAVAAKQPEPTAMTLATADANGHPSARIVLLKGYDDNGFVFFTNYLSRKGQELATQPWASLLFFWQDQERQIRINGQVHRISDAASDEYFHSRPLGSRIGAWASAQSQPVSIAQLEQQVLDAQTLHGDQPPRPEHWGGYCLVPCNFEFWQGRPSRLHDRLQYKPDSQGVWHIERLSP
jgi:pyridoxamine 5'-phosphate oxidase